MPPGLVKSDLVFFLLQISQHHHCSMCPALCRVVWDGALGLSACPGVLLVAAIFLASGLSRLCWTQHRLFIHADCCGFKPGALTDRQ